MDALFMNSKFNGDISKWDTSNVLNMRIMFYDSVFNGDISAWNTSNVKDMTCMFKGGVLKEENKLPNWYLKNVSEF